MCNFIHITEQSRPWEKEKQGPPKQQPEKKPWEQDKPSSQERAKKPWEKEPPHPAKPQGNKGGESFICKLLLDDTDIDL